MASTPSGISTPELDSGECGANLFPVDWISEMMESLWIGEERSVADPTPCLPISSIFQLKHRKKSVWKFHKPLKMSMLCPTPLQVLHFTPLTYWIYSTPCNLVEGGMIEPISEYSTYEHTAI